MRTQIMNDQDNYLKIDWDAIEKKQKAEFNLPDDYHYVSGIFMWDKPNAKACCLSCRQEYKEEDTRDTSSGTLYICHDYKIYTTTNWKKVWGLLKEE